MRTGHEKLGALSEELSRAGADAERLEMVERARRFKRSWVDMAEGLLRVRESRAYERWGYPDLYAYCAHELQIKRASAEKLIGSFAALREHAPEVLREGESTRPIPTCDAVDYFARALRRDSDNDTGPSAREDGVIAELRAAVFDEGKPVTALRRQFDPILHPREQLHDAIAAVERARGALRRLTAVLQGIEGIDAGRIAAMEAELGEVGSGLAARTGAPVARASGE